jgi:dolichol-phosphate mannosyltransferase
MAEAFEHIVVVLPTFNERENLGATVARIRASVPRADILVVDDNSPDGTGELADELAAADAHVLVLHREAKRGLGAAYLAAFDWALRRGYTVIVECDADGSHRPEELPDLLAELADHDLAVGSRWVRGSLVEDWPLARRALSRAGSFYARRMLRLRQRDVTGGYRAFRSGALRRIGLDTIASQGYCFQIEMLWRTQRAGLRIAEVPITFTDRQHGTSKMRWTIAAEALLRVTLWGLGVGVPARRVSPSSRSDTAARTR